MADNAEGVSDAQITFKVKASGDINHTITMSETATVLDLKTKLASSDFENIAIERQRLIYSGRVMKNDDTLASYKVKPGNTIHLVKSAASNPTPAPSTSAPVPQAIPSNMAAGTSAGNLLAGLTGARFAGQAGLPSADMFGADGGMGAPPSEDDMANMLSNPAIAQHMNEALNNPQIIDLMIQQNPMLRDMPNARELLQSPFFRNLMTNPDAIREAARMRRAMGGAPGAGGGGFPMPGVTDTTPGGAPSAGNTEGNNAQAQLPQFPGLFGGLGGAGAGAGGQAANPFAALFAPPNTGVPATRGEAGATAGATSPPAAGGVAAANPFANPFGAGGAGQASPFGMTPEMMQQFMGMIGGGGGGGGGGGSFGAPADNRPPEERYADQLRQLNDMGFFDFDRNIAALRRSGGSVQGAIEYLLSG